MSTERKVSVNYSKKFLKSLSRLPERVINLAEEKEMIFIKDIFDPRLDTHKLHGRDKEMWAFSITRTHRIKFIFLSGSNVLFLEVGTHDIYE